MRTEQRRQKRSGPTEDLKQLAGPWPELDDNQKLHSPENAVRQRWCRQLCEGGYGSVT
ncbi:hypothetical protein SynWH8101_1209 [Synechococcus sp. WH 8101]|nr:hypothetical protein SynWH8101_1209 [Synechococcus sp. WH 8101]QNI45018.1 hypothetical protein SynRCC2555_01235 [Synechococcus sp. WH 8101]